MGAVTFTTAFMPTNAQIGGGCADPPHRHPQGAGSCLRYWIGPRAQDGIGLVPCPEVQRCPYERRSTQLSSPSYGSALDRRILTPSKWARILDR